MKQLILLCSFLGISVLAVAQSSGAIQKEEVSSVDAIIRNLYSVISGPAGQPRNWARMRALFKPDARLAAVGKKKDGSTRYLSMRLEDYIRRNSNFFEENGFFEKEIGRTTERFGQIVHVFSTYETRFSEDGEVKARGINSIQLIEQDGRFWITNILWNGETEEYPIPEKYLKP